MKLFTVGMLDDSPVFMMDLDLESAGPMDPNHKDEDDVRSDMEIQDQVGNEDQMAQPQQLEYSLLAPNMKLSIRSNENWHEEYSYISPVTVISNSGLAQFLGGLFVRLRSGSQRDL